MESKLCDLDNRGLDNTRKTALPQRGGEVNLTLGGIDLNNSGSVVVREDKKLLTVLFPDGRDGRAFTLKAETSEDLFEWKTALEQALAQAPNAALVMGHNGIFRSDASDSIEGDKRPIKSLVVGRPILLALEDIDGGPSFLEKALRFLEKYGKLWSSTTSAFHFTSFHVSDCVTEKKNVGCIKQVLPYSSVMSPTGVKVEGILRQSADVEEVDRRVQEYEQGKTEFGAEEDAHVVGDCVKHVLRELPSSPVPASCCTALLEAYKIDRKEARINAMRCAILETFPEPNRRLLQRMTQSAVAACMAPLLLRPLLAGECELEDEFDVSGDSSAQLLAAANAANNAQAIITTLLEEYENIFDEENIQRCSMSADSRVENSGSEDSTDDDNIDVKENGYHDAENEVDQETDEDADRVQSGKLSESSGYAGSDLYDYKMESHWNHRVFTSAGVTHYELQFRKMTDDWSKWFGHGQQSSLKATGEGSRWHVLAFGGDDSDVGSSSSNHVKTENSNLNAVPDTPLTEDQNKQRKGSENPVDDNDPSNLLPSTESYRSMGEILSSMDPGNHLPIPVVESGAVKQTGKASSASFSSKRSAFWGRSNPRKTPSVESVDSSGEEELAIQRLEIAKNDLQHRIAKEARGNAILQASLERRKQALHERRLALEQDVLTVSRLQEQLQAERDLRAALEVGLSMSSGQLSNSRGMDSKTKAELEEIALAEADVARLKQKVAELHHQLNQQRQHHYGSLTDVGDRYQHTQNHPQQRFLQQDFDSTLAFCNHERKQRTEENLMGTDWRNIKGQVLASGNGSRQPSRKQFVESSPSDSKSTEASTSMSVDDLGAVDSASVPSTSRAAEVGEYARHPSVASSTLVELTTRLDFFKERRSQLMEQLHNLDLNYGSTTSQDFVYKPSSPSWS
ncbi:hypothetical protein V8G54_034897 [Vigna mungo]|uniref:Rho GTPase-activating protein 7 n=1 Tax=Vigna mungo TaxID=3915 RepID=A0AAQ3RDU0_VIGMU